MIGLDVTIFERFFRIGNKSGNSILRAFSDSGMDVMERSELIGVDKETTFCSACIYEGMGN